MSLNPPLPHTHTHTKKRRKSGNALVFQRHFYTMENCNKCSILSESFVPCDPSPTNMDSKFRPVD